MYKNLRIVMFVFLISNIMLIFTGCENPKTEALRVDALELSQEYFYLYVGESDVLLATVYPFNANNQNIIWSTSDSSVIEVEDGIVTAVGPGNAQVFAISEEGNYRDSCYIDVLENE